MARMLDLGDKRSDTGFISVDADTNITAYALDKGSDGSIDGERGLKDGKDFAFKNLFLGNASRTEDGVRDNFGHKLTGAELKEMAEALVAAQNTIDGEDPFAGVAMTDVEVLDGKTFMTVELDGKGGSTDTLNIVFDFVVDGLEERQNPDIKSFIDDDRNSQDTFVFASDGPRDGALLGYDKDSGGSNSKSGLAYEAVTRTSDAGQNLREKYDVSDVELGTVGGFNTETYTIKNGSTKQGEPVVDTITFVDDLPGFDNGLFDLG